MQRKHWSKQWAFQGVIPVKLWNKNWKQKTTKKKCTLKKKKQQQKQQIRNRSEGTLKANGTNLEIQTRKSVIWFRKDNYERKQKSIPCVVINFIFSFWFWTSFLKNVWIINSPHFQKHFMLKTCEGPKFKEACWVAGLCHEVSNTDSFKNAGFILQNSAFCRFEERLRIWPGILCNYEGSLNIAQRSLSKSRLTSVKSIVISHGRNWVGENEAHSSAVKMAAQQKSCHREMAHTKLKSCLAISLWRLFHVNDQPSGCLGTPAGVLFWGHNGTAMGLFEKYGEALMCRKHLGLQASDAGCHTV